MKRKTLQQLCEERYENADIAKAVADHATEIDTVDAIESGALTLPSETDALIWYEREQAESARQEASDSKRKAKGGK